MWHMTYRMECKKCGRIGPCKGSRLRFAADVLLCAIFKFEGLTLFTDSLSCAHCGSRDLAQVAEDIPDRAGITRT